MFLQDRQVECPIYYPEACSSTSMTMTLPHVWNGSKWTLFVYCLAAVLHACMVSTDLLSEGQSPCFVSAVILSNISTAAAHVCTWIGLLWRQCCLPAILLSNKEMWAFSNLLHWERSLRTFEKIGLLSVMQIVYIQCPSTDASCCIVSSAWHTLWNFPATLKSRAFCLFTPITHLWYIAHRPYFSAPRAYAWKA